MDTTRETGEIPEGIVFGREYFRIDPDRTALIVIDMQRGFLDDDAAFKTPRGQEIVPNVNALVDGARKQGMPVIWTQSDHSFPGGGLILQKHPRLTVTGELCRGHETFDLYQDMVQPAEGEHRIVKHKYDAFHDTDLDAVLRNLQRNTIILTGVATEICCESTARTAYFRDYQVVFVDDATAALDPEAQEGTCQRMDMLFARRMSTAAVIEAIRGAELPSA